MAVLAHAGMTRSVIVCNGYKDREYIRGINWREDGPQGLSGH